MMCPDTLDRSHLAMSISANRPTAS
jgi:hypothetical protein